MGKKISEPDTLKEEELEKSVQVWVCSYKTILELSDESGKVYNLKLSEEGEEK